MLCQYDFVSRLQGLKRRILGAVCIATIVWLVGCSGTDRKPLVVYSPHGKDMLSAFELLYEQDNPGVDVQWLDMGSQDAYDRIRTERHNPQADVWWGAPSLMFQRAEEEGLLEIYEPTWARSVPDDFRSSEGYWYGTFITPEVIMYNNRVLSEDDVPDDWDDLLDERFHDKIVIRYPLASGTMRIIFSSIIYKALAEHGSVDPGFEWLLSLDANTKTYAADPTQLYLKIAREEGILTLWNLPDVVIQRDRNGYPFGYRFPKSGTPLIIDGLAIVKGSKDPEEARRFYEFITSKENMIRQAEEFYRIPAREDIDSDLLPSWLQEIQMKPMNVDWNVIAQNEKEWMKRWDERVKGMGVRR